MPLALSQASLTGCELRQKSEAGKRVYALPTSSQTGVHKTITPMNLRKIGVPVGLAVLLIAAYQTYGWLGVAGVGGGIVMWLLLHFNRLMSVVRKASNQPMGYVASAVMLNAKLRAGVNMMHVVAMTRSLGQPLSKEGEQPEIFRWTDGSQSFVTCTFNHGRLASWELQRPAQDEAVVGNSPPAP